MPDPELVITAVTAADADACAGLIRRLPDWFTSDEPSRVAATVRDGGIGWVARAGGEVVGAVLCRADTPEGGQPAAEIVWAAVELSRHGRGTGTALVRRALDELAARGCALVLVKTLDDSADYEPYVRTRAFWAACGFVQVDTIDPMPGWGSGNPAAVLVAALRRTAPP